MRNNNEIQEMIQSHNLNSRETGVTISFQKKNLVNLKIKNCCFIYNMQISGCVYDVITGIKF